MSLLMEYPISIYNVLHGWKFPLSLLHDKGSVFYLLNFTKEKKEAGEEMSVIIGMDSDNCTLSLDTKWNYKWINISGHAVIEK